MSTRSKVALVVLAYLVISFFNFGAINANLRRVLGPKREYSSIAMCYGFIPVVGTVIAIFGTGFIEDGFSWQIG